MGLFDELAGGLAGKLFSGGDKNKLFESIMGLINNPQTGGLSGLAQVFKDKGLGDAMSHGSAQEEICLFQQIR